MTRNDEARIFTCKDDLLKGKLFQVSVSQSTNDVDCSCKFYNRYGSLETPSNCDKTERTKLKRTRAWFEFQSCLDLVSEDEEKLDMVRLLLRDIDSKLQKVAESDDVRGQETRVDSFIGPVPLNEEGIRNPNISRNKGCGSRIKSSREISIQSKGQRTCRVCNKTEGHNARTCPTLKDEVKTYQDSFC
ncbi:hypothetical protein DCAR_0728195 [Daucus carota subsp. sativus]|uniref:Uncharacterized protein n=1 Tax=Daucus carota subsp. sativus TaxID=79200 RepID=A0AAF0XKM1_DAUCS|nr:PREDICTED: uncharacterized protein LOC108203299 [Daucus carota subsp. sativus]WOH08747.1 hypothetical protein DCAR_0728195 [Daucus carota subsp. sativus]